MDRLAEKSVPGTRGKVPRWARLDHLAEAMGIADPARLLQFLVTREEANSQSWAGVPPVVRHAVCLELAEGQEPTTLVGAFTKDTSARDEDHAAEMRRPFLQLVQPVGRDTPGQDATFRVDNNSFSSLVENLAQEAPYEPVFDFPGVDGRKEAPTVKVTFKARMGEANAACVEAHPPIM